MQNAIFAPSEQFLTAQEPFLKWAGGKRWLHKRYPELLPTSFNRYFEPFLGSGSIFFHLSPKEAHLSDANSSLIETYLAIKMRHPSVLKILKNHSRLHSDEYYYDVRSSTPKNLEGRAAKFIYLNRTCWNALYRVNKNGSFNVPRGTKNNVILPSDNFLAISNILSGASLNCCDFSETLKKAGRGDFAFIDPPYTVAHNLNGFVKYNDRIFTWKDQIRLRDEVKMASERGCKVLVTNADHESVRELYSGLGTHHTLERATVISGKNEGRKRTTELAIVFGY